MIKIDKDVPVPTRFERSGKYPWHQMEVGDSFFVPGKSYNFLGPANQRHAPKRFTSRKVQGGLRVWRIE